MTDFRTVRKGRFDTLVHANGMPISAALPGCTVITPPHVAHTVDKVFMTVRMPGTDTHDYAIIKKTDDAIRRLMGGQIDYSPVRGDTLVIKIPKKCLIDDGIRAGELVDIDVSLGNFGSFGYCWLANVVAKLGIL